MTKNACKRKSPLSRLTSSVLTLGMAIFIGSPFVMAAPEDQAKRIHDRLTGNLPSEAVLAQMSAAIVANENGQGAFNAAMIAINNDEDHSFYNVTLKNWSAPWTNREGDVFAPLNDYMATVIGAVRDDRDFRTILYGDYLYRGDAPGLPPYAANNNNHYETLEAGINLNGADDGANPGYSLKRDLVAETQSQLVPALANGGASGVVTSRAGARAFLIAGTNRAAFRFTMLNHLCLDMEQVHDVTRTPDRIRQDVSRSPGGDSRIFLNNCVGCHSGMDPLAQALAYHNYAFDPENDPTGENGQVEYTQGTVQPKYFNNDATFPAGYVTPDDSWSNYWRSGPNTYVGWDAGLPGAGQGASSMFEELANTEAFARCHVRRVFKTMCMREPENTTDQAEIETMVSGFSSDGDIKSVFAQSAAYCKGE